MSFVTAPAPLTAAIWGAQLLLAAWVLRAQVPGFPAWWLRLTLAAVAVTGLAGSLAAGNWVAAVFCAATLVLLGRDWWKRNGKRAAQALGLKSLALVAGLVERLRDSWRPVPGQVPA